MAEPREYAKDIVLLAQGYDSKKESIAKDISAMLYCIAGTLYNSASGGDSFDRLVDVVRKFNEGELARLL